MRQNYNVAMASKVGRVSGLTNEAIDADDTVKGLICIFLISMES